ncbi:N-acetylmannosaminyltransferase [Insulibacter thermoxylanivorax]|uniref:N-acetylglucosaminyldiphosphoundecaprenol N-acetyl-beta-D-mannosaminyltransferase n=1 Tax=Insulibacter thermoxylanivorax TaxID=2749268 RepID=A0A916VGP0_9BACL|nr:WecB/TagA/CpsF family glycosyltransferase [Insulibacter thermoxylanivorax]GFR39188.1 N-acetylmannosaminyltransferase [Insulibacter thermoxylanivorax]
MKIVDVPFIKLFDIPISAMGFIETANYMEHMIERKRPQQVVTINPIMIMEGLKNPDFRRVLEEADLNVPDGAGVVWASKVVKRPVTERVAGIDLMLEMLARAERNRYRVFLLGADRDTIVLAVAKIRERYPNIEIVGYRNGYFQEEQDEEVIAQIREANPDLLFVGRSLYTQEPWIAKYKDKLQVPVMMGVGGSFDVIAGKLKRAPAVMQKMHLEWLYRLIQEPKRIGRMTALPKFMWTVLRHRKSI